MGFSQQRTEDLMPTKQGKVNKRYQSASSLLSLLSEMSLENDSKKKSWCGCKGAASFLCAVKVAGVWDKC